MLDGIGSVIIVLVLVVLISAFSVSAKTGSGIFSKEEVSSASIGDTIHQVSDVQAISYEQAMSLVQAYAKEKRRLWALETLQKQPNGDFYVSVGGAGRVMCHSWGARFYERTLPVHGL